MRVYVLALLTFALIGTVVVAQEPVRVPLDETGIADWRFLNPYKTESLDGRPLEFVNTTGDRTFVVTIPYESELLSSAYLGSRFERGQTKSLESFVCHVIDDDSICTDGVRKQLQSLEALRGFLEVVRRPVDGNPDECRQTDFFKTRSDTCAAELEETCNNVCRPDCVNEQPKEEDRQDAKNFKLVCELERLFWRSACDVAPEDLRLLATRSDVPLPLQGPLEHEARALVSWLFRDVDRPNVQCSAECAWCKRNKFILSTTPDSDTDLFSVVEQRVHSDARDQFRKRRLKVAQNAVVDAAGTEVETLTRELTRLGTTFEQRRSGLEKQIDFSGSDEDLLARCRMRELESAARLLASYGHKSQVPFDLPDDVARDWCWYAGVEVRLREERQRAVTNRRDTYARELTSQIATADQMRARTLTRMRERLALIASNAAVDLLDCRVDGTKRSCAATAVIPPNQRATFPPSLLSHHPDAVIRFRVVYYGDPEVPPNGAGTVARTTGAQPADNGRTAFGFGIDTTSAYDLPPGLFQGHRRHTGGSGSLSFQYLGVTRLDLSSTIRFKSGDFGGPDSTNQLSATQYQAKVAFGNGVTFQAGRIRFAQPSAAIAVAEAGEGLRGAFSWRTGSLNAAYIIRRESDAADNAADVDDDDADVYLFQYNPVIPRIRNFLATFLYGEERNDRPTDVRLENEITRTVPRPYTYATFGIDSRFGVGLPNATLTVAGYHSVRNARPRLLPDPTGTCGPANNPEDPCVRQVFGRPSTDGNGTVALLTFTINRSAPRKLAETPSKSTSAYAMTLWLGGGSGDDTNTTVRDEGYLGETAGYANDVIFLNLLSKDKVYSPLIGRGLSNKYYLGAQYSDSRVSPLAAFARLFKIQSVESRSTAVSVHTYRFNRSVDEQKYAGSEVDVEFKVEVPKNVNWTVKTALFRPGRAIERLAKTPLMENPWSITASVSISLEAR